MMKATGKAAYLMKMRKKALYGLRCITLRMSLNNKNRFVFHMVYITPNRRPATRVARSSVTSAKWFLTSRAWLKTSSKSLTRSRCASKLAKKNSRKSEKLKKPRLRQP